MILPSQSISSIPPPPNPNAALTSNSPNIIPLHTCMITPYLFLARVTLTKLHTRSVSYVHSLHTINALEYQTPEPKAYNKLVPSSSFIPSTPPSLTISKTSPIQSGGSSRMTLTGFNRRSMNRMCGIPYILMKFANPVPGYVISGPVRYRISPDLGLNNGL